MIENWFDAIFWLGVLCVFLYAWLCDTKAQREIADSTRVREVQDQMGMTMQE